MGAKIDEKSEDKYNYLKKKYFDITKGEKYVGASIPILTNLTKLDINQNAINGIYLFGCDLLEESEFTEDFNPVFIMRKARKLKCFQEKIKEFIENYYISGLVLMGKPKEIDTKKIKFYLKVDESKEVFDGEILEKLPEKVEGKIYKFKFKRKKEDLSKMMEDKNSGEAQCVANYLNICLGKILERVGYIKDRTSRKILYYKREESKKYNSKNQPYLCFPALKAVCETYEGGNIYMKLLPKYILKTYYTYRDFFDSIECETLEERLNIFKQKVLNKRGITIYNHSMIKIDDIIFKNPYEIEFSDKIGQNWSVGDYLTNKLKIKGIHNENMPIAVRIIDKGGKLKGDERKYIHIPCQLLSGVDNIFGYKIDIKNLIQNPNDKLQEIEKIRNLIEKNSIYSQEDEHNFLGTKFEPVSIDGKIMKPPLIIFGDNIKKEIGYGLNGFNDINLRQTTPYSKVKMLNKIDIYTFDLFQDQYETIWKKLEEASKQLGISFNKKPMFYILEVYEVKEEFESYIQDYFNECDKIYSSDTEKETKEKPDFIFLFMNKKYKYKFHYSIFKSVINRFNWCIPTQVILYDKKFKKTNLSQFTNILCQMWAKKGYELYICDFSFISNTLIISYSSNYINKNKILTSVAISLGTKLYEYVFFSDISEAEKNGLGVSLYCILYKALKTLGKTQKKQIENIVIYRDAVNKKQENAVSIIEIPIIKQALKDVSDKFEKEMENNVKIINPYKEAKWILILVSKINEIKLFLGEKQENKFQNIPIGTLVDRVITNQDKYDFYLNSTESRQGTCSSTHYTVLYNDTKLNASQIYKLTYYLTFLSYNTTKSIRIPAPLYFVTRRNQFTIQHLNCQIINPASRTLNISL